MKTQQQKRTGRFTSISLISITLIGVFAAGSWFVYQHYRPSSPTNSSTAQFQTTGYLVVPEWGIKVPLSASIKDAYYTPNKLGTYGADGRPAQMLVGLKSLDSHGCAVANDAAPVLLFRTSPSAVDPVSGDPVTKDYPGVTIGSYFYGYSLTQSTTCENAATFQTLDAAFTVAVKGIVPDTIQ